MVTQSPTGIGEKGAFAIAFALQSEQLRLEQLLMGGNRSAHSSRPCRSLRGATRSPPQLLSPRCAGSATLALRRCARDSRLTRRCLSSTCAITASACRGRQHSPRPSRYVVRTRGSAQQPTPPLRRAQHSKNSLRSLTLSISRIPVSRKPPFVAGRGRQPIAACVPHAPFTHCTRPKVSSIRNGGFTEVDLSSQSYTAADALIITHLAMLSPAMRALQLSSNHLQAPGALAVARTLRQARLHGRALQSLNIADNEARSCLRSPSAHRQLALAERAAQIGDLGAQACADALIEGVPLTYLNVANNGIGGAQRVRLHCACVDCLARQARRGRSSSPALCPHPFCKRSTCGSTLSVRASAAVRLAKPAGGLMRGAARNAGDQGAAALGEALGINKTLVMLDVVRRSLP